MRDEQTDAPSRRAVGSGPQPWRSTAGTEWSWWDLRFCVVCVVDHGGDWDALDAAIQKTDRYHGEARWSHLLNLTERLRRAGLTAAELAGASANDRTTHARRPERR